MQIQFFSLDAKALVFGILNKKFKSKFCFGVKKNIIGIVLLLHMTNGHNSSATTPNPRRRTHGSPAR
jgi:hypothetical protein